MRNVIALLKLIWNVIVGVLKAIRYGFGRGFKWVVLALSLPCFALGVHFLVNGPYGLTHPAFARIYWWYYRPSSSSSPVMAVSFFLMGWFLVNHFRLLRARSRRSVE
jgi:hypothetical protein